MERSVHMFDNQYKLYKDILLKIVGFIVLFLITYRYIIWMNIPQVVPDEFGYWTAASYINGYDWSDTASFNTYYSIGYGFILAFFQRFFDGVLMYKMALIFNSICLGLIYLLLINISNTFWGYKDINYFISLACCFYTTFVSNSVSTQPEVFLTFLFTLSVKLYIDICKKATLFRVISYSITLLFLYCIHQRTLGILLAGILSILLFLLQKKKQFIIPITAFGVIAILMLLTSIVLKNGLIENVYIGSTTTAVNDYSGQISKVKALFSLEGIKRLILVLNGQLWQLGTASVLLVFYSLFEVMRKLCEGWKEKFRDIDVNPYVYIFFSFLFTWGISAVYTRAGARYDSLIYGRYIEMLLPVFLLVGWMSILSRANLKQILCVIFIYGCMGLLVNYTYSIYKYNNIVWGNICGIFRYIWTENNPVGSISKSYFVEKGTLIVILVTAIIALLLCGQKRKWGVIITLVALPALWTYHMEGIWTEVWKPYQDNTTQEEIAAALKEYNINDEPVYFVYEEDEESYKKTRCFPLQILMKEKTLYVIEDDNLSNIDVESYFVVVNKDSSAAKTVEETYEKLKEGSPLELYHTVKE